MLIFHDGYNERGAPRSQTLDVVARTIDTLAERGWCFTTVDELLGVEPHNYGTPARPGAAPAPASPAGKG